jgi:DNA-binding response OmpR family regulator
MQHILVVDDDIQIAALFEGFLEASGYRVTVAHDGVTALQADAEAPVDAVITDLAMPGMNGRELIDHLRKRRPQLPAMIVSGYPSNDDLSGSRIAALMKPVRMAQLVGRLETLLAEA